MIRWITELHLEALRSLLGKVANSLFDTVAPKAASVGTNTFHRNCYDNSSQDTSFFRCMDLVNYLDTTHPFGDNNQVHLFNVLRQKAVTFTSIFQLYFLNLL